MATSSDIKRLKTELRTIWMAIFDELKIKHPRMQRQGLSDLTRVRFLAVIDEAAREVAADQ